MPTPTIPDSPTPADLEAAARYLAPAAANWRVGLAESLGYNRQTIASWIQPNNPRTMPPAAVRHLRAAIELESIRRVILT